MSKIDTSTTAGKIAVMQAFEGGKEIQCRIVGDNWWLWVDSEHGAPQWGWGESEYRIKPQTVEEAAEAHCMEHGVDLSANYTSVKKAAIKDFIAGYDFCKAQDNG